MAKLKRWRTELAQKLDLPIEALGGCCLQLMGKERLLVEGHRGLIDYSPEDMILLWGTEKLHISGSCLSLEAMSEAELLISGRILSIGLE